MKINSNDYEIDHMLEQTNFQCKKESKENPIFSMLKKINEEFQKVNNESGEKVQRTVARIRGKLKSGKKLSAKELEYLRKYCSELYEEAMKVQLKRNAFEEQIKHSNSKEDVMEQLMTAMDHIIEQGEMKEALMNAYQDVVKEFKKTSEYKELPASTLQQDQSNSSFFDEEEFDCQA